MKFLGKLHLERERLFLASPLLLMAGILWYFTLPKEPSLWVGSGMLLGTGSLLAMSWRRTWRPVVMGVFLVALGFAVAQWRTYSMQQPLLAEPIFHTQVEGVLEEIIAAEKGSKLVLKNPRVESLAPEATPRKLRVSVRTYDVNWQLGDKASLKATLHPLPKPELPGGYDFGRHLFYQGLGAVGYSTGDVTVTPMHATGGAMLAINQLRHELANELREKIGGAEGAIAAALTVGEMRAIPEDVDEAMRDSGLSHVLSISGLHMALAAGVIFFSVRLLLTLVPAIAHRFSAKKIAAAAALVSSFAYLLLAGAPVPAQRSFLMVAFVLVAVMIDRRGISLRSLAWAAVFVLLFLPESMLGASFQMSFAATLAIVALYERGGKAISNNVGRYVVGLLLTSLVASLATMPFVLYHFNRFSPWGLLSNMVVVPLASFIIMPGVVLTLLLMPFGWEAPGVWLQGKGIAWMVDIAHWTAGLPGAGTLIPSPTDAGLLLCVAGMLGVMLVKSRWCWLGVPIAIAGLLTALLSPPPDVLVSDDAKRAMVRLENGQYAMLRGTDKSFTAEVWLRHVTQKTALSTRDAEQQFPNEIACDERACQYTHAGQRLILVKDKQETDYYCTYPVEALAAWWYIKEGECAAKRLIGRRELERHGAHALWINKDGIQLRTAVPEGKERRWMPIATER